MERIIEFKIHFQEFPSINKYVLDFFSAALYIIYTIFVHQVMCEKLNLKKHATPENTFPAIKLLINSTATELFFVSM